jgi:hypothetical protein
MGHIEDGDRWDEARSIFCVELQAIGGHGVKAQGPTEQKFFASFFQKRSPSLLAKPPPVWLF